ncbi:glycine/sarcosine/betaine reductase complex component C subunit alpha [Proteinivorax hydrogeniformans]|uniref:Glycine/sarcosine/betaine reductase complex component C subunit alpha n=1 Tax=Proteinivorax hydrogeniformans TaxID=1826727 RepID=A0AAU8HTP0_9FIRM
MTHEKQVSNALKKMADALEGKNTAHKIKVALTTIGSELLAEELVQGALMACSKNPLLDVVIIGPKTDAPFEQYNTDCEKEAHSYLEKLLKEKKVQGAVTLHYNFPLGTSTVGKVNAIGSGKEMYIATTTGTSAAQRVEAMILNAILGISAAKSGGIKSPTVGVLNVEGARQVEKALNTLKDNGLEFSMGESVRKDGGSVLRGNDILAGSCDVVVCDTLTGNILMKLFTASNTGGQKETVGWGYGPGIGRNMENIISIISRASGAPVVSGALQYTYEMVAGDLPATAKKQFKQGDKAGLKEILADLAKPSQKTEEVTAPPKKTVTEEITGIDILQLDDGVQVLWKEGIYAESGMGCAGPVIMVNPDDLDKAKQALGANKIL